MVAQSLHERVHTRPVASGGCCVAIAVILLWSGCAAPVRIAAPSVDPGSLGSTAFVHYLARTSVVTVDEGGRAVLMIAGDAAAHADADVRWNALTNRGMIHDSWKLQADSVLDHGTFAYMLFRTLDVQPTLNTRLASWFHIGRRRAAMRWAAYEGLMAYAPPQQPVPGGVVVTAVARAEQGRARTDEAPPDS